MSTISAGVTTTTALVQTGDTTGALVLQTGSTPTTALTLSSAQNATFANTVNLPNTFGFKNRIINGGMSIDQRNAGASFTPANNYTIDRWLGYNSQASKFTVQQNAGSVTPPAGFINYLGVTSSSSYSITSTDYFAMIQPIEGLNVADLGWGTANAKTVTLSAWVYSSLTGTFGGALSNSATNRSYPFSYTISSANTWTQISVTIAGDTSGTWLKTNGVGIYVAFGLGVGSTLSTTAGAWAAGTYWSATGATSVVGTNGATFYITGVQLEVGSQATSFDFRDYGRELMLCQRYYQQWDYSQQLGTAGATGFVCTKYSTTDSAQANAQLICSMRTAPTLTLSQNGRFVLTSSVGGTATPTTLACNGTGSIVMGFGNNSISPGYGWVDGIGILKATAEL